MICGDNILQSVGNLKGDPESFDMYPNPAFESLTIEAEKNIRSVTVTNAIGKLVYSGSFNSRRQVIDIKYLPAGIYYLKVNRDHPQKFVKY